MASPGEIDPTDPTHTGAGAEGGAIPGDSAGDSTLPPPLPPPEDIDKTNPFDPTGALTPYPDDNGEAIELSNMDLNEDETPLLADFLSPDEQQKAIDETNQLIQDLYPQADFSQIDPIGWGKKIEARLFLLAKAKAVGMGKLEFSSKGSVNCLKSSQTSSKRLLGLELKP